MSDNPSGDFFDSHYVHTLYAHYLHVESDLVHFIVAKTSVVVLVLVLVLKESLRTKFKSLPWSLS